MRNPYVLGMCGAVLLVFFLAGQAVSIGVQDLTDKAHEQLELELHALRAATVKNILHVVDELELLASQKVMERILDKDEDSQIQHSLKGALRASTTLAVIDCVDLQGAVVASTVPRRVDEFRGDPGDQVAPSPSLERIPRVVSKRLRPGTRAVVERMGVDIRVTIPLFLEFAEDHQGYLHARIKPYFLLPSRGAEWFALVDRFRQVVVERGPRPSEFDADPSRTTSKDQMVLRSARLDLPETVAIEPLDVWVAKPYSTLFGRSIALRSRVFYIWLWSAIALALVLITFLRFERRYESRIRSHARALEHKNEALLRSEEGLREQTRLAQAANQAKTEFLATMSHELRTPLNAVLGMNGLLLDSRLDLDQRELASTVESSASALLFMINDILDFSHAESGRLELEPSDIDLEGEVASVFEESQARAGGKDIEALCRVDPALPARVRCDARRLRRVLANLLDNAFKFTEEGSVEFSASVEERTPGQVRIRFAVADTGIGIAEDERAGLFESFSQVDSANNRRFGGMGLGLAISQRIVRSMGGAISLESHPGKGSTFSFSLALEVVDGAASAPGAAFAGASLEQPVRRPILVAEDNVVNQRLMARLLEKLEYECEVVDNGRKAVEAVEGTAFSLVLMDVQMPEMDGVEATRRIRASGNARARHTPIVAVTANAGEEERKVGFAAGMDDYLAKPVNRKLLEAAIVKWISSR